MRRQSTKVSLNADSIPGDWNNDCTLMVFNNPDFGKNIASKYKNIGAYKFTAFNTKFVSVFEPSFIKDALKHEGMGSLRNMWPPSYQLLLGKDSLTLKYGNEHRKLRKLLNSLFNDNLLKRQFNLYLKATHKFLDVLCSKTNELNDNDYVEVYPLSLEWAYDIALNVIFGNDRHIYFNDTNDETDIFKFMIEWVAGFMDDIENQHSKDSLLYNSIVSRELLLERFQRMIDIGRNKLKNGESLDENCSFTKLLMIPENDITNDELLDIILVLLHASHHTTGTACCNILNMLNKYGNNNYIMDELYNELSGLNSDMSFQDINKLRYLNYFIKEVLRITPPVLEIPKMCINDTNINGYNLEKGTTINISVGSQAMNDNIFENPDTFDPNRYKNNGLPSVYQFCPFGGNTKICIGYKLAELEMKLLVYFFVMKTNFEVNNELCHHSTEHRVQHLNGVPIFAKFYPK